MTKTIFMRVDFICISCFCFYRQAAVGVDICINGAGQLINESAAGGSSKLGST